MKVTSVRLDDELTTELKAVARAEGVAVSEAVRAALRHFIATRIADPEVRARLIKRLDEEREFLERMGELAAG